MIAIYLGFLTVVIGRAGITIHPHTRGTIDHGAPIFGVARLKRDPHAR